MTLHRLSGPAPRHTLVAEIRSLQAEIDAGQARMSRLILRLARLPGDEPEPATPTPARAVPIKVAKTISGKSPDTLRRRGEPAGWAFKVGGRWMIDPAGLANWMAGRCRQAG